MEKFKRNAFFFLFEGNTFLLKENQTKYTFKAKSLTSLEVKRAFHFDKRLNSSERY